MAIARLHIRQGARSDAAGRSVIGTLIDGPVSVSNEPVEGLQYSQIILIGVPVGSELQPQSAEGAGVQTLTITPDVVGAYRFLTYVQTATEFLVDVRDFQVTPGLGVLLPPSESPLITDAPTPEVNPYGQPYSWGTEVASDPKRLGLVLDYLWKIAAKAQSIPAVTPAEYGKKLVVGVDGAIVARYGTSEYISRQIVGALSAGWAVNADGDPAQTSVASAGSVIFPIASEDGIRLYSIVVLVDGTGHSALPATLPTVTLQTRVVKGGTVGAWANVAEFPVVTDPSTTAAEFDTPHEITTTTTLGLRQSYAMTYSSQYRVVVTGEAGANSAVGLRVLGCTLSYS